MPKYILIFLFPLFLFAQEEAIPKVKKKVLKDTVQVVVLDTISNGEFTMELDERLFASIRRKENKVCSGTRTVRKKVIITDPAIICSRQTYAPGFKIQIMYTKSREEALNAQSNFRSSFPYLSTKIVHQAPDFKILVGDYLSRQSAASDYAAIKRKFPGALITKWKVYCAKAK